MKRAFSVFLSCSIALASLSTYNLDVIATGQDTTKQTIDAYTADSNSNTSLDNPSREVAVNSLSTHDLSMSNFTTLVDGIPMSLRGVNVKFNGEELSSEFPAVIYKTRTMVPLRAISENMGADVAWIAEEQAISIELGGKKIRLQVDNSTVDVDGSTKGIAYNVPPKLMRVPESPNGTTMVPLRFISEELGAIVNWDNSSFTANIDYSPKSITPSDALVGLKLEKVDGKDAIVLHSRGSSSPDYAKKLLNNPKRLVLDLKDTVMSTSSLSDLNSNTVSSVRTSQYYNSKEYSEDELITRVVLDIDPRVADYSHDIRVEENKIIIIIENNSLSLSPPVESKPELDNSGQNNSNNNSSSNSKIRYTDYGITLEQMVEAQSQRLVLTDAYGSGWQVAKPSDIKHYLDPGNFPLSSVGGFQFLDLSKLSNVSASDLNNNILKGRGILENQGNTFIEAGRKHGVNEVYLVSHALLETGNGKSRLATGVLVDRVDGKSVEPRVVYNMFGIGAADSAALRLGSEKAYIEGWFSPEEAILGGAKFIGEKYINRPGNRQNTLYKMRWNPDQRFIWHQYATDIGWAFKQTANMKRLYDLCSNYELVYDIPMYR